MRNFIKLLSDGWRETDVIGRAAIIIVAGCLVALAAIGILG